MRVPLVALLLAALPAARAADAEPPPAPKAEVLKKWGGAEAVVLARLDEAVPRGAGLSDPPVYMTLLKFTVADPLRGGVAKGTKVSASHSVRQRDVPKFPVGKDCLVALSKSRGGWAVLAVEEATPAALADARSALALPFGWAVEGGKLRSPWAGLKGEGKVEWEGKGLLRCAVTGRPAYLAGAAVEFTAEPVPPKVEKKFANPDGDGEYKVTVKNPTDRALTVPALRTNAKGEILWKESLAVLCQGKVYTAPGAEGIRTASRPLALKPGESVSAVVNALALKGPEWPRGGYRIEFTFALGERAVTKSFYYLSRHHDPIREALK